MVESHLSWRLAQSLSLDRSGGLDEFTEGIIILPFSEKIGNRARAKDKEKHTRKKIVLD